MVARNDPAHALTVDDWVRALRPLGGLQKTPTGWKARCPAHDDRTPSLSLDRGVKGRPLVHCYAGCAYEAVRAAAFGERQASAAAGLPSGPGVRSWRYQDADGHDVLAVVRRDGPEGKQIAQWRPAAAGGWEPGGLKGAAAPLLRLATILADTDAEVLVVEGEQCADAAAAARWPGKVVTTWPGGTQAWKRTDWTPLRGRQVAILADADDAGRKAARAIAAHLRREVGAAEVRLAMPEGDAGEDVADWLDGSEPGVVAQRIAELLSRGDPDGDVHDAARGVVKGAVLSRYAAIDDAAREAYGNWGLALLGVDPAEPPPTADLLLRPDGGGALYSDRVNVIAGLPGSGKTWLALWAACELIRAERRVLFIDGEDSPLTTLQRVVALAPDLVPIFQDPARVRWVEPGVETNARLIPIREWLGEDGHTFVDSAASAGMGQHAEEVVEWFDSLVTPLTKLGAGLTWIDHIAKRAEGRARGPIHASEKLALVQGSALTVSGTAWTRIAPGSVRLRVDKDRPGGTLTPIGHDVLHVAGQPDGAGALTLRAEMPDGSAVPDGAQAKFELVRGLVVQALEAAGPVGIRGTRALYDALRGHRRIEVDAAVQELAEAGEIIIIRDGRAHVFRLAEEW